VWMLFAARMCPGGEKAVYNPYVCMYVCMGVCVCVRDGTPPLSPHLTYREFGISI